MIFLASRRTRDERHRGSGSPVVPARFASRVGYAAALLPAAVVTLGALAAGRAERAGAWWARAGEQDPTTRAPERRPGAWRLVAHALVCVPLGLLALVPVGIEVLFVLRGVLYPLVDHGPYDHSWGGPSMAGAWAVHFLAALPFAAAGLGALWLLARLHTRLAGRLWGRRAGAGPVLALLVSSVAGVLLVIAWIHQL
ncbi:hypothetical protein GCM10010222_15660 [Streptomyces tanashiensis]|uniref:hypothetical protein n=1 Tax=Streptomyces tanashiensis TaxID=67367 RepID=UPI0016798574|nr:hypothetical protein [Streptomyces tanashiensis]GGS75453.1 hypothetical protein GCM10010222_15660 [Streptomyces tanashiensis]